MVQAASAEQVPDDGGEMSDEYSDDDDPGYRIVLVEDVGELYPDISYRLRRRGGHGTSTGGTKAAAGVSSSTPGGAALPAESDAAGVTGVEEAKAKENDAGASSGEANNTGSGTGRDAKDGGGGEAGTGVGGEGEEEETGDDDDDETPVDEDALVSHHMPDLVEGLQPMFVQGGAVKQSEKAGDARAKAKSAAATPEAREEQAQRDAFEESASNAPGVPASKPLPVAPTGIADAGQALGGEGASGAAAAAAEGLAAAESVKEDANGIKEGGGEGTAVDDTVYYDCFDLKIVYERNKTGFEETKDYPIEINGVIAGRYQILEFLGAAAFSKAVQCVDLTDGSYVCIKIIKNNKDFFDQSLDEIKILKYINAHDATDDHHLLQVCMCSCLRVRFTFAEARYMYVLYI